MKDKKPCCKSKKKAAEQISEPAETSMVGQFTLRPEIGRINFRHGAYLAPEHTPDDIVIEFLRVNPNRISMFKTYPFNWKDLLNNASAGDSISEDE